MSDVLTGGGSRHHASPRAAGVLLVAVLTLLAVGDAQARRLEIDALVDRAREGQVTGAYADRRLAATVEYASPQLTSPAAPAAVRADLQALVRREAGGQVAALQRRRDRAAGTPVLVWHRSTRQARLQYVRYLEARLARLQDIERDLSALYGRPTELQSRLQAARDAIGTVVGPARAAEVLG